MLIYTFDRTMDGLLSAVFDAYALHQQPDGLVGEGDVLPLFCDEVHGVTTADDKARRVWTGLEKRLKREPLRLISISWLSESRELYTPLFRYIHKVFRTPAAAGVGGGMNFADPDVLYVTNTARRVLHEQLRMKQFLRFQKAKDGTYLGVVSPDNDVLPLIIDHFQDRFQAQPWLIYDARRRYGYNHDGKTVIRITFADDSSLPFSLEDGRLSDSLLSDDDKTFQELWRIYFKAICIRERLNPKKQRGDMPRRYWKYMTEKQ